MHLIAILLGIVALLTILSGSIVFFGSKKADRARSTWFFIATFFALLWMMSIAIFLVAESSWNLPMPIIIDLTFISAIFIDVALLGYITWKQKSGKVLTGVFLAAGLVISAIFLTRPSLLYTNYTLSSVGNSIDISLTPYFFVYVGFFCALVPAVLLSLLRRVIKSNSISKRGGDLVLMIGFAISGTAALIVNLILPFWTWNYIWIGPLTVSTTIIAFYYTILRYRVLNLESRWLKVLSYIVIVSSLAVIYIVIFYAIFAAMFRGSSPSLEVIVLNFLMILIVLALLPAASEMNMFIRSLISNQQIDIIYIIKKLSRLAPATAGGASSVDIKELAAFLAEHMHFEYIGILIGDKIYGSDVRPMDGDVMKMVQDLGEPENGVWQELEEATDLCKKQGFSAVAALRNGRGKTFGQLVLGKPMGKISFSRRDIVQIETIINLTAVIIDSKTHKKA